MGHIKVVTLVYKHIFDKFKCCKVCDWSIISTNFSQNLILCSFLISPDNELCEMLNCQSELQFSRMAVITSDSWCGKSPKHDKSKSVKQPPLTQILLSYDESKGSDLTSKKLKRNFTKVVEFSIASNNECIVCLVALILEILSSFRESDFKFLAKIRVNYWTDF